MVSCLWGGCVNQVWLEASAPVLLNQYGPPDAQPTPGFTRVSRRRTGQLNRRQVSNMNPSKPGHVPILFAHPKNRITDRPEPVEGLPPLPTTLRQAQGERALSEQYWDSSGLAESLNRRRANRGMAANRVECADFLHPNRRGGRIRGVEAFQLTGWDLHRRSFGNLQLASWRAVESAARSGDLWSGTGAACRLLS